MTNALVAITVFAHIFLPLFFLVWIYFSRAKSKLDWISIVMLVGAYLLMMWYGGAGWSMVGVYWPSLFLAAFVVVSVLAALKRRQLPLAIKSFRSWVSFAIHLFIGFFFLAAFASLLSSRDFPSEKAVDLRFPLVGGTYYVVHGGTNEGMNHHFPVRAQKYALDIEELSPWGIRAKGLSPEKLEDYEIFGAQVVAPCDGEVLVAESGLPDQTPPETVPEKLSGNHIILFCSGPNTNTGDEGMSVKLAHLKQNSLTVKVGDRVKSGQPIAQVGNTGNTTEPHLHVHAVKGRFITTDDTAFKAEGLPVRYDGDFLIRGDQVTVP